MPSISSVSGTLEQGQSIVISGSDFGTKSPAAPLWWDDFEAHTDGVDVGGLSPVHGSTTWSAGNVGGSAIDPIITSANQRTAKSTRSALIDHDPHLNNWTGFISAALGGIGNGGKLYYFFRHRLSKNGNYSDNFKPFVVWTGAGTNLYIGYSTPGDDLRTDATARSAPGAIFAGIGQDDVLDVWAGYEEEIGVATSGGTCRGWVHLPTSITQVWNDQSMSSTVPSGESYTDFDFGDYHNTFNYIFNIDDCYLDNTFARVMVGDATTWAGCAKKEICIPSAWSSTEITATLRHDAFADDATVYLYVVDSGGNVNSDGFEITLGGSGGGSTGGRSVIFLA